MEEFGQFEEGELFDYEYLDSEEMEDGEVKDVSYVDTNEAGNLSWKTNQTNNNDLSSDPLSMTKNKFPSLNSPYSSSQSSRYLRENDLIMEWNQMNPADASSFSIESPNIQYYL